MRVATVLRRAPANVTNAAAVTTNGNIVVPVVTARGGGSKCVYCRNGNRGNCPICSAFVAHRVGNISNSSSIDSQKFSSKFAFSQTRTFAKMANPEPLPGMRVEYDSIGPVQVPKDRLWAAQTQRSIENFKIGDHSSRMPLPVIYAQTTLKKCCAIFNRDEGMMDKEIANAIIAAADEVLAGKWDDEFPLVIFQTGSGTQTNMNVNEVL